MINLVLLGGILVTLLTGIPVFLQMRKHPKGLVICFLIEMWERFSFYGMRGLLIFYLTKQFLFTDDHAASQYSSYMTLIYLIPLVGGIVADRWIGTRKAAIFGAVLLVLGHFGMAFEGKPAEQTLSYHGQSYAIVADAGQEAKLKIGGGLYSYHPDGHDGLAIDNLPAGAPLPATLAKGDFGLDKHVVTSWAENAFYLSISLIIMGVGFLKPNVSTIVGQLYGDRDPRRDSGFQLYYFGINLGSFWAAIVCGWLGQSYGWKYGFGAAGLGMLLGLVCFMLGKTYLEGRGDAPDEAVRAGTGGLLRKENLIYLLSFAGVGVVYFLVQRNDIVFLVLVGLSLLMLGYVGYNMATKFTRTENFRILLALVLSVASIVFFALEELAGSALNLFTDRNINLQVLSTPLRIGGLLFGAKDQVGVVPTGTLWVDTGLTAAQSSTLFSAAFILILAPIFAALFSYLGNRGRDPDPVKKFAFGIVATGLGLMVLVFGAPFVNSAFRLPLIFLVLNYFLTVVGEMSLSPVGLSQQTKLSPSSVVSTMMALWFTGLSWAQFVGGKITSMTGAFTINGEVVDPGAALHKSLAVFSQVGLLTIAFGVLLFVLSFFIKGWAGGVNDTLPVDEIKSEAR
ncbi:MAG: MFS transporter [Asticcacaulis sp.]